MQPHCCPPQCRSQLLRRSPPQRQAESSGEGAQVSIRRRWAQEGRGDKQGKWVYEPDSSPTRLHLLNRNCDLDRAKTTGKTWGWEPQADRWTDRQQGGKTGPWSLGLTEAASLAAVSPGSRAPAAGWVPPATSEASVGCNINAGMGSDTGWGRCHQDKQRGHTGQHRVDP